MVLQDNALQKFFLMLPLLHPNITPADPSNSHWEYADVENWDIRYPTCGGSKQSPISLTSEESISEQLPPLQFHNYDVPMTFDNLTLTNNGHTVFFEILQTANFTRPYITGGTMLNRYEAVNVHFHWGNKGKLGSEHVIDNCRFDVEMHIVHRNVKYANLSEAVKNPDGLSVLGVMLKIAQNNESYYSGMDQIFDQLPALVKYGSKVSINGDLSMKQLLGDLNTNNFFTYNGSLTIPVCEEAVIWQVFPDPLPIGEWQISKFWSLLNSEGGFLVENNRPTQERYGRPVYYRTN